MAGLIGQLEVARRALMAEQNMLSVLSHNIANANTPGYTRQDALLGATDPMDYFPGQLGTGVTMESVRRMRDTLTDVQVRQQSGSAGRWGVRENVFRDLQTIFKEPSDTGLNATMGKFFNAWQDLANHPEEPAYKTAVMGQAQAVVDQFHTMSAALKDVSTKTDTQISQDVDQVNQYTSQIAQLNQQISNAETAGQKANDLRDRRDTLLDGLSKIVNVSYDEHAAGMMTVRVGGLNLVEGSSNRAVSGITTTGGQVTLNATDGSSGVVLRGELSALEDAKTNVIPGYQAQLDALASGFASQVNSLQATGPNGSNIFTGATAASLALDPTTSANPARIDAGTSGATGDNSLALKIAGLRVALTMNTGSTTFQGYYTTLAGTVASGTAQATDMNSNQTVLLQQMQNQRESTAGVNMEEEMTKLITAQKSFQAASQMVTTVTTLMDSILVMVK